MLQRLYTIPLVLLVATLAPGCDGQPPWADEPEDAQPAARTDLGPTAAYDRHIIFLGPGDGAPTAAVFDFQALSDSLGVRRGARARLSEGGEWAPLLDAGWEMEPMREPWHLVPHGPLKIVVSDAGELASVEIRDDIRLRLEPGPVVAEHAPDAGTQLVIRQGALDLDGERVRGVLLDAQLARSVGASFLPRTQPPSDAAPAEDGEPVEDGDPTEGGDPADSLPGPVSPTARAGTEAMLLDTSGYYVVIASSAAGDIAWIHGDGRDEVSRGLRLEPVQEGATAEGGVEIPTAWQVLDADGGVVGELRARAVDRSSLDGPAGATSLGYVLVTGWLEDRRVRREIVGLVRHIR